MIYELTTLPGSSLTWLKVNKWSVPFIRVTCHSIHLLSQFLKTKEKSLDWNFEKDYYLYFTDLHLQAPCSVQNTQEGLGKLHLTK